MAATGACDLEPKWSLYEAVGRSILNTAISVTLNIVEHVRSNDFIAVSVFFATSSDVDSVVQMSMSTPAAPLLFPTPWAKHARFLLAPAFC